MVGKPASAFEEHLSHTCVFEVDAVDVDRFFVSVLEMPVPPRLILVDQPEEFRAYLSKGRFAGADVRCSAWMSIASLRDLLRAHDIRFLLIDAHRIPDVHIVLAARAAGSRVLYIQHGMYIPFMKRTLRFFAGKLLKTLRYLYYAFDSGLHLRSLGLAVDLFRIHVLGAKRDLLRGRRIIFPDSAAVYSNYWRQWHVAHYAFPPEVLNEMGTPDLRTHRFGPELGPRTVAYCYQTLVEDGRIGWEPMAAFYRSLKTWSDQHSAHVVVKSHPRGRADLIARLRSDHGFEITSTHIPNTSTVIGHFSSLLAYWGVHGRRVIAVTLPGHPVHESIASWANVVESLDGLELAVLPPVNQAACVEYFGHSVAIDTVRKNLFDSSPASSGAG